MEPDGRVPFPPEKDQQDPQKKYGYLFCFLNILTALQKVAVKPFWPAEDLLAPGGNKGWEL